MYCKKVRLFGLYLLTAFLGLIFVESSYGSENRVTPVVKVVKSVSSAVVNIRAKRVLREKSIRIDSFFDIFDIPQFNRNYETQSLGSGVIIDSKGLIVTNNHLVDGASDIEVALQDQSIYKADLVGTDIRSDIAVIRIDAKRELPVMKKGDSDQIMIGESVVAIGNPFGLSSSVSTGVISANARDIKLEDGFIYQDFIQVDAPINPGNSGGALVNMDAELIGITSAIYRNAEGIGFAIPINKAIKLATDIISHGGVVRGWFGIIVEDPVNVYGKALSDVEGVFVERVFDDSPASKIDIRPGDLITRLKGKPVKSKDQFVQITTSMIADEQVDLLMLRKGKEIVKKIKVETIEGQRADKLTYEWLKIKVVPNYEGSKDRKANGMKVIMSDPKSGLGVLGIRNDDIIVKINKTDTNDLKSYRKAVVDSINQGGSVIFLQRGNTIYQISYEG